MSLLAVNIFDVDVHILFSGTFVIAIRAVERLEAFVNRVFVGNQISSIGETLITFLARPGSKLLVDHFDVFYLKH